MTNKTKPKPARRFARLPKTETQTASGGQSPNADDTNAPKGTARETQPTSKTGRVIALLQRPEGATLEDLITETGWLPHTTRAALTGLRKKGHAIVRSKRDQITCYCIMVAV